MQTHHRTKRLGVCRGNDIEDFFDTDPVFLMSTNDINGTTPFFAFNV
jgi:hypothetical protein